MITFITALHITLCFFLIVVVLLQTGKGADMGAAFGGASQTVFGATGALTLLHKVTTVTAVLFMLTSMSLAWYSAREQAGGGGLEDDIFDKEKEAAEAEAAEAEAGTETEADGGPTGTGSEAGAVDAGSEIPVPPSSSDLGDTGSELPVVSGAEPAPEAGTETAPEAGAEGAPAPAE